MGLYIKVRDAEVKRMAKDLQSSGVEVYTSLALHGAESVNNIEDRIKDSFPVLEHLIEVDWRVDMDGLEIDISSPSEGIMERIRDEVTEIVYKEATDLSVSIQRDIVGRVSGASF